MYNENEKMRASVFKTEVEKLDPNMAEEEGVYIDYSIDLPKHTKKLTYEDCSELDIEQLENLDRMGYKLPGEIKEKVMEFREAHMLHYKRGQVPQPQAEQASWNYNQKFNDNLNLAFYFRRFVRVKQ